MRGASRCRVLTRSNRATLLVAGLVVSFICMTGAAPVGSASPDENQLKAACLNNFARYVEWPSLRVSSKLLRLAVLVE